MDPARVNDTVNAPREPSRDPRLQRRTSTGTSDIRDQSHNDSPGSSNPAIIQASAQSPEQLVSEGQGPSSGETFARCLSSLTENIIALAQSTTDQGNLKKKIEVTESTYKRAKNHSNFPSTITTFQQWRKDDRDDIGRIEEKLREHKLLRDELEHSVASLFRSNMSNKHDSEMETKLREISAEVSSAKKSAFEAQSSASNTRKELEMLKGRQESDKLLDERFLSLQARVDILTKTTETNSNFIVCHGKEIEALAGKADKKTTDENSSSLHQQIQDMETKLASLASQLQLIPNEQDAHRHLSEQISHLKTANEVHAAALEGIPKLKEQISVLNNTTSAIGELDSVIDRTNSAHKKLDDISKRLVILENASGSNNLSALKLKDIDDLREEIKTFSTPFSEIQLRVQQLEHAQGRQSDTTALRTDIAQLTQQYSALLSVMASKDDMHFKDMELLEKTLNQHSETLEKLATDEELRKRVEGLSTSLATLMDDISKRQTTLDVGLRSLEERYNHLSTETLARNMITLIQESYPLSLPAVMDQINSLKAQIEQLNVPNIASLPAQLERTTQSVSSLASHIEKDRQLQLSNIQKVGTDMDIITGQLTTLWNRVQTDVPLMIEDMKLFRNQLNSVIGRSNEHAEKVNQDIRNREVERQAFLHDMKHERDRLNNEIESLAKQVSSLKDTSINGSLKDIEEKVKSMEDKIKEGNVTTVTSLLERIHESEKATTKQLQTLTERFDEMTQSTKRDIVDAVGRLESLEKVKEDLMRLPLDKLTEIDTAGPSPDNLQQPKIDAAPLVSPVGTEHRKRRRYTVLSDEERSSDVPNVPETRASSRSSPNRDKDAISSRRSRKKKKRQTRGGVVNADDE